jgi:hypothetical protein
MEGHDRAMIPCTFWETKANVPESFTRLRWGGAAAPHYPVDLEYVVRVASNVAAAAAYARK